MAAPGVLLAALGPACVVLGGSWGALGKPPWVPGGPWVALAWSLGPGRVAAIPKTPNPAPYFLYRLEWTRALNARNVSCRRLKWLRPSWIRQTFCTFVEPCREAAPFRSIDFSPLVSSCRVSPCLVLSYLVLASVAFVFSCLGFSCLRLLWSPLVVSPLVLSSLVLVPACSGGFLAPSSAPLGGPLGAFGSPPGASSDRFWPPGQALEPPGSFLGLSRAAPGPSWEAPGPLLAALGCSWASLGPPWGAPGGSLRRSGRLPGGSWGPLGGSKVAFCRKAEFRRQYSVFHGFWGVREAS